jgi:hypothetical protein
MRAGSRYLALVAGAAILIDPQIDYGFDLAHLREHMETGDPVRVDLELRAGDVYATQIDDA